MLARHSPPLDTDTPAREKVKRPPKTGKKGPGQKVGPQHLPQEETPPLSRRQATTSPETLSTPALPLPLANTQDNNSPPSAPFSLSEPGSTTEEESTSDKGLVAFQGIEFHHASEAEFARLLTYYGIEWQYEPNQFPLQWRDGRPTEMFSPDFYLTEYDLYIELTTMRQALVRRKNRKLRLLRALYPEINVKLLYRRDYQRLLERFGMPPEDFDAERPGRGDGVLDIEAYE
jgi:hypothetical protein